MLFLSGEKDGESLFLKQTEICLMLNLGVHPGRINDLHPYVKGGNDHDNQQ